MNADSYFEIGNSHQVCQDYALSGTYKDMSYGIVSDGCSSAKHSEIGAQILCHVAQYYLQLHYDLFVDDVKISTIRSLLGNSIFHRADELRKLYPISRDALQATLLIVLVLKGKFWVFGWGDGYFIFNFKRYQDSAPRYAPFVFVTKIDYPITNAPFYLSTDRTAYINKWGAETVVQKTCIREEKPDIQEFPFDTPYSEASVIGPGDMITVMTDGLGQYLDQNKKPIEDSLMIPLILDYPSVNGSFVERTMNFLKKDLIRKNWSHSDDIGVATIVA